MENGNMVFIDDSEYIFPEYDLPEPSRKAPGGNACVEAINRAMLLRAMQQQPNQNLVISASSLYFLLGLAMNASSGKTQKEIKDIITKEKYKAAVNEQMKNLQLALTKQFKGGQLHLANGIFLEDSIAGNVKEDFVKIMNRYYKADILQSGPDPLLTINDWAAQHTKGMIPQLLNQLPSQFRLCLLNAIAFRAKWQMPYEKSQIEENQTFTSADGSTSHVTMLSSKEHSYIEDRNYTGFIKYYKDNKYAFMALLPKKKGQDFLGKTIENIDFCKLFTSAKDLEVEVKLPEFEVESTSDLKTLLESLGAKTMFTPRANFSGIIEGENLMVDSVLQKARIKVDRAGTRAAAASAMLCVGTGIPKPKRIKKVCLNRPFLYAVMECQTGVPVFAGMVNTCMVS